MTTASIPEEKGAARIRRLRVTVRGTRNHIRTVPASIALALLLLITSIETGTVVAPASDETAVQWGAGVFTTIDLGQWWSPLTALLVPWDPGQLIAGILASLVLLGIAERYLGTVRAIAAFLVTGILGIAVGVGLQWAGSLAEEWWATGTSFDITLDPLSGIIGAFTASSAGMALLWRRRVRVVTFSLILMFVLYDGDSSNVYRLFAALAGLVLGERFARGGLPRRWARSSHPEVRTLLAALVAVTAVGPIVTLVSGSDSGPFYYLGSIFASAFPDADETLTRCAADFSAECDHDLALLSLYGAGPLLQTFVPLILLLVAAIGLRRGRRLALSLAIGVNMALAALAFFSLDVIPSLKEFDEAGEYMVWAAAAVLVPLLVAIVLIAKRRFFRVRSPRSSARRWGVVVVIAFVVLSAVYLVVALLTLETFVPAANPAQIVADVLRRYVPVNFLGGTGEVFVPSDELAFFLFQWVGPVFWLVVVIAILALFRATTVARRAGDLQRFRALLHRGGGGTLGYLGTWPGNAHWFSEDAEAAVAYRVVNGIAITMSDPVCAEGRGAETIAGFVRFCEENSWIPVFYSVHDEYLPVFDDLGWQHVSVGEETLLHPTSLEIAGKSWQKARQPLNRAIKAGITAEWTRWDRLPLTMINQITELSEQWVAEKELPEMGFTIGGMEELKDPEVALMLAVGPDGRLQAVTSWMPSYRNGRPIGWTIDFMRRADESMNGIMEFVIASAALHMQGEGIEVLSLSGAPLATAPLSEGEEPPLPTIITRLLEFLARALEPAYGFSSLFRFKAKFNPEYSTISMAYPDPLALPAIGAAIGKAYLPDVSPSEAMSLVRTLAGSSTREEKR